jgi:hypothetical protein
MRRILAFTATFLITASALAAGDVYRWKDANGTWHYSDQPQPGAELVMRASRPVSSEASESTATPAPAATAETTGPLPVSDAVAAQVRQEAATAKSEQCKRAEDAYQKAIQARGITKTDEAGNKVFMTDAEIDAYRLQARSFRDSACGPGP